MLPDDEHYALSKVSKLPPIPKFGPQSKTPQNVTSANRTPKKTRINYRDLEEEYSLGPNFGVPQVTNGLYPSGGFKRNQYISQKYIDYAPLAKLSAKRKGSHSAVR